MTDFRWPKSSERALILGKTGSGKSQFAMHLLSFARFDKMPYVVFDYKHDPVFDEIDRIRPLTLDKMPREPGLYIVRPHAGRDDHAVEAFLRRVLIAGRIGLFFDEGYSLPNGDALNAIYMQGRSKFVPTITLSQRPVWISRYAISEAEFIGYFHLNDKRDHDVLRGFLPKNEFWNFEKRTPKYHLRWHCFPDEADFYLSPAPDISVILARINARLRPKWRII